jgi:replicative DNA helicase
MSRNRKRDAFAEKREPPAVAGRTPPNDLDLECAVLSACMLDRAALDSVLPLLSAIHFYSEANGRIYEAIQAIAEEGKPVDLVTVAAHLRSKGQLAQVGGPSYLAQISDATPAVTHVEHHAREVREKWRLRSLIATCQRTAAEGYGDVGSVATFIEEASSAIEAIRGNSANAANDPQHVGVVAREAFTTIERHAESGGRMLGRSTGFARLDAKTAGISEVQGGRRVVEE